MRDFDVLWFVLILLIYSIFPILFIYNRERNRPRPTSPVIHLIRYTLNLYLSVNGFEDLFGSTGYLCIIPYGVSVFPDSL